MDNYTIDRSDKSKIIIKGEKDEIELKNTFEDGTRIADCYIIRFEEFQEKDSDEKKVLVCTNINGFDSETIISMEEFNKKYIVNENNIDFDVDYCALFLASKEDKMNKHAIPVLIQLTGNI